MSEVSSVFGSGIAMNNEPIKVAFAINEAYVHILIVTISSLITHACDKRLYFVYVITEGLSKRSWERIRSLETSNVRIEERNICSLMNNQTFGEVGYQSNATYYRLFIDRLFPETGKILYLDTDISINHDVSMLYDVQLGDYVVGVCKDWLLGWSHKYVVEKLRLCAEDYFNAGVMLVNVPAYKKINIGEECIKLLGKNHKLLMADQDALNLVLQKINHGIKYIDRRWNVIWEPLIRIDEILYDKDECCEYDECITNPYIIHFTSKKKPWIYPELPLADYFWHEARESGAYEELLIKGAEARVSLRMSEASELFSRFLFPWNKISAGDKIILYGAGSCGRTFYEQMKICKYCRVLAMCDRCYAEVKNYSIPVIGCEDLSSFEYDKILIAIESQEVAKEVIKYLIKHGIPKEKIVWDNYR